VIRKARKPLPQIKKPFQNIKKGFGRVKKMNFWVDGA